LLGNLVLIATSFTPELLPSRITKALAGRGAPIYTGRCLFFIDILPTLAAPYLEFVGKNLDLGTTILALVERHSQVSAILSRAFDVHSITFPLQLQLYFNMIVKGKRTTFCNLDYKYTRKEVFRGYALPT
jgi:hypothetical protein